MLVYCIYPVISKSPKQLPNRLKRAETCVILIVFVDVLCEVRVYNYRCLPSLCMKQVQEKVYLRPKKTTIIYPSNAI